MIQRVLQTIRRHGLIGPGQRVLVAVSGGADSVALLLLLHRAAPRLSIRLTVCHLHHGLRGRDADGDAAFVARLCRRLRVPCLQGRSNVRARARRGGVSIEMAAREARYAFFRRCARRAGADVVATAHTADDSAETVILRLCRGSGLRGLGGIAPAIEFRGLRVVRPLIDCSRPEIEAFLRRQGVVWREDRSNADPTFLRNRVRHEILPLLEARLNPSLRRTLARTATILREDERCLDALADEAAAGCRVPGGGLDARKLVSRPLAVQRRVILAWLMAGGADAATASFADVDRVLALAVLRRSGRASASLPRGRRVALRTGGRAGDGPVLYLRPPGPEAATGTFAATVAIPGRTRVSGRAIAITTRLAPGIVRERGQPGQLPARASLRRSALRGRPLRVRNWRPGDRIRPLGLDGSKKLQDVFVDAKVPPEERGRIPVITCGRDIVWVPGYRVAQGWDVTDPRDAMQIRIADWGPGTRGERPALPVL